MDRNAVIVVAVGAAIGGVARYAIAAWFAQRFPAMPFPWGTFVINVTGSFLIGIVAELSLARAFGMTPLVRLFAATGILGGFTTFSAFSLELSALVQQAKLSVALAYALASVVLGVLAATAGVAVARIAVR